MRAQTEAVVLSVPVWRLSDQMSKRSLALFSLLVAGLFVLSACADPQQPTATNVPFNPTPGGQPAPTSTPSGATPGPQPTEVPSGPDPEAGQALFQTNCAACHNTNSTTLVGPGLAGVAGRAETRVAGMTADEYLHQSIMEPGAYLVEGFGPIMPQFAQLSSQDIDNLVAYLKTLE